MERGSRDRVEALGLVMPLAALREKKTDPRWRKRRDYHDDDQKRRQRTTLNFVHCVLWTAARGTSRARFSFPARLRRLVLRRSCESLGQTT